MNKRFAVLQVVFLLACVGTGLIVKYSAANEPFYGVASTVEVMHQVGGAFGLSIVWLEWSVFLAICVFRGCIKPIWLIGLVVSGLCIFLLVFCALGYAHDLQVHANDLIPE